MVEKFKIILTLLPWKIGSRVLLNHTWVVRSFGKQWLNPLGSSNPALL